MLRWWLLSILAGLASLGTLLPLQAAEPARAPQAIHAQPLVAQLCDDALDGQFDRWPLFPAALIASGVTSESQLRFYEARFARCVETLQHQCQDLASPRDRAATALALLYRELLTGNYVAECADLSAALDRGDYNCITATILYAALVQEVGLTPEPLHAPGHVWLRLRELPGEAIETTCRTWFSLPRDPQRTPATQRQLSPVALVGKLFYNGGLLALNERDFAAATLAFERSRQLDPLDEAARQNWLAALNNGALAHCERGDFTTAQTYLAQAQLLDPQYPPLAANQLHVQQRWIIRLCEQGEYAAALARLQAEAPRFPQAELFRDGRVVVYRLWAEDLQRRGETHAALAKVQIALAIDPQNSALRKLQKSLDR